MNLLAISNKMGWWEDFTELLQRAGSAYYTIATNSQVRQKVAGKVLDSLNAPGTIGEKLVGATEAYAFISGHNPNEIPQSAKDVIRTSGDVIGFAESQLPGIDAIHAGLTTATELAAGRDPAHLKDFIAETAVAFAPPGVSAAYTAYKELSNLPIVDAAIKRETIAPPTPSSVPLIPKVPMPTSMPMPMPIPMPMPKSELQPLVPTSRIERLDNLAKSQQEIGSFTPRPFATGMHPYAKLKKRRAKKTK